MIDLEKIDDQINKKNRESEKAKLKRFLDDISSVKVPKMETKNGNYAMNEITKELLIFIKSY